MKKLLLTLVALAACMSLSFAQDSDAVKAAEEAAKALYDARNADAAAKPKKADYWAKSLMTNINFGQTSLTNWAAGGDNTYSLKGYIDANANYKNGDQFWNNRLQIDYGFIYASSKPLLQKSDDRFYFESKYGYQVKKNLFLSANYNFKSQFTKGWTYATPGPLPDGGSIDELSHKEQVEAWRNARVAKSGFLSPAYTNLALGIDWKPSNWLSVNFAPLTGGYVIVNDPLFRKAYSMAVKKEYAELDPSSTEYADLLASGELYRGGRFELGAQVKIDAKVLINDNFAYTTQLVLFSNYLRRPQVPRVNWDNRFDWKLAKYFSLTLTTNLIYDETVMIKSEKDLTEFPEGKARVQFKESLALGFTYTIATKKK